jgi:hypothetical protein
MMSCWSFEQTDKMLKAGKCILYDVMWLNIHWKLIPCAISSYGKGHPQKCLYFVGKATTKRRKKSRGWGRREEYVQKLSTFHCCLVSRFERNLWKGAQFQALISSSMELLSWFLSHSSVNSLNLPIQLNLQRSSSFAFTCWRLKIVSRYKYCTINQKWTILTSLHPYKKFMSL